MSSQENLSQKQYDIDDIDVLEINHLKSIAQKKLTRLQYQQQIQKSYAHFSDIRVKQKFINQLKLFYELKSIDQEQLKAWKFDRNQYRQLLINKAELFYKIYIKGQRTQDNKQNFLRNQLSLQYLQKFLSFLVCEKPFKYSLQTLLEVKSQIITRLVDKRCQQIRINIKKQRQKRYYALEKKFKLKALLEQKRKAKALLLEQKQQQQYQDKAKSQSYNIQGSQKVKKQIVQIQKLRTQLKDLSSSLSKNQNQQATGLKIKLQILEKKQKILKKVYAQLKQQYRSIYYSMTGLLKTNVSNPIITYDVQYEQLEIQLKQLNKKCAKIQLNKKLSGMLKF